MTTDRHSGTLPQMSSFCLFHILFFSSHVLQPILFFFTGTVHLKMKISPIFHPLLCWCRLVTYPNPCQHSGQRERILPSPRTMETLCISHAVTMKWRKTYCCVLLCFVCLHVTGTCRTSRRLDDTTWAVMETCLSYMAAISFHCIGMKWNSFWASINKADSIWNAVICHNVQRQDERKLVAVG